MFVYRSNSLEELVEALARVVSTPQRQWLAPETILIQSAGMERYLSRELARRLGVAAGMQFPFPRAYLRDVLNAALGAEPRAELYERASMTWVLFDELKQKASASGFEQVAQHLSDDVDGSKRLALAARLAHLFDQYVTYRPTMVLGWQEDERDQQFQAQLWRSLVARFDSVHFSARCMRFLQELNDEERRAALPERLCLVGGPGLPPLFLQMLSKISELIPVHIFSFTVCQEYFADSHALDDPWAQDMAVDEPVGVHSLLSSMGRVGADYQYLLELVGNYEDGPARFVVPTGDSTLSRLQRSLIEGRAPRLHVPSGEASDKDGSDSATSEPAASELAACDDSLSVDVCHSRLREIEVLHDRILSWFADDPSLRPEDVVVLAPSIELYSPLIESVFSSRAGDAPRIPFRIADRSERFTNPAARAMLLALQVLRGRFAASEVLDLLQLSPVRQKYAFDAPALERISAWVQQSNIRSAIDAAHREQLGLPSTDDNTWRFGLRRLLLGYFVADDGQQIWEGTVPFDDVAAADAEVLGRFVSLLELLFEVRASIVAAGPRGLRMQQWHVLLLRLFEGTVGESDDGSWDASLVRVAIEAIFERARMVRSNEVPPAHFEPTVQDTLRSNQERGAEDSSEARVELDDALGLAGVLTLLSQELDEARPSTDFLVGGVTFCALLPLRTIPFRRVCVLGLNQGEFPRSDVVHQLNLMNQKRMRGDRSLRDDDRYLFLEVLLAAREKLSLFYVGRSIQDNTEIPPSVVLGSLDKALSELEQPRTKLVRRHALQPFSAQYFAETEGDAGRSFDQVAYKGALALQSPQSQMPRLYTAPLPFRQPEDHALGLSQLISFWRNPSRSYLEACGLRLQEVDSPQPDRETIVADALERYWVGDEIVRSLSRNRVPQTQVMLRRGNLPVGIGGEVLLKEITSTAQAVFDCAQEYQKGPAAEPYLVEVALQLQLTPTVERLFESDVQCSSLLRQPLPSMTLAGAVGGIYGAIRVTQSFGKMNFGRRVTMWLEHLALCASNFPVERSVSVVRGEDGRSATVHELPALDPAQAQALLNDLVVLMTLGRQLPLPFFGEASLNFAKAATKKAKDEQLQAERAFASFVRALNADSVPDEVKEIYRGECPLYPTQQTQLTPAELPAVRLALFMFERLAVVEQLMDATGGAA